MEDTFKPQSLSIGSYLATKMHFIKYPVIKDHTHGVKNS